VRDTCIQKLLRRFISTGAAFLIRPCAASRPVCTMRWIRLSSSSSWINCRWCWYSAIAWLKWLYSFRRHPTEPCASATASERILYSRNTRPEFFTSTLHYGIARFRAICIPLRAPLLSFECRGVTEHTDTHSTRTEHRTQREGEQRESTRTGHTHRAHALAHAQTTITEHTRRVHTRIPLGCGVSGGWRAEGRWSVRGV